MNRVAAPSKIAEGWRLHGGAAALAIRLALTAAALVVWFWTQSLIGGRVGAGNAIGDRLLDLTAPVNAYLISRPPAADGLLIASSGIIDLLGLFLLARWIFGGSTRPFIGLIIVLGLRQTAQALVTLPIPANAIWHYPGFPSLLLPTRSPMIIFFRGTRPLRCWH